MSEVLKIAAVGISAALCCVVVRKQTQELAVVLALTAGVVILWTIFSSIEYITSFLEFLAENTGISGAVFSPVLKVVGIAIVTRIASALCKDAGESGIASAMEFAGTVCALAVTIPLAKTVIQTIGDLT